MATYGDVKCVCAAIFYAHRLAVGWNPPIGDGGYVGNTDVVRTGLWLYNSELLGIPEGIRHIVGVLGQAVSSDVDWIDLRGTMPLHADLYLDRIDLARYAGTETCQVCRVDSLAELLQRLRSGRLCAGRCPHWPRERVEAFRLAIDAGKVLPTIPPLGVPRPAEAGLLDLNEPDAVSPVLITGNSRLTHEVLLAVLSTTTAPVRMASVDTQGHTVDMSLVYGTLTPEAIADALSADGSPADGFAGRIILPGLAESLAAAVSELLGRPLEVGPICAAELPLFFAQDSAR